MGLLSNFFNSLFKTYSDKQIDLIEPIVDQIEALADKFAAMTDDEMQAYIDEHHVNCPT
jgi:preprotein translocase subunit SecA